MEVAAMRKRAGPNNSGGLTRLDRRERGLWVLAAFVGLGSLAFFLILLAPARIANWNLLPGYEGSANNPSQGVQPEHYVNMLTILLVIFWYYVFRSQQQLWELRRRVWKAEVEREVLRKNQEFEHQMVGSNRSLFEAEADHAEIARLVTGMALNVLPANHAAIFDLSGGHGEAAAVAESGRPSMPPETLKSLAAASCQQKKPIRRAEAGAHVLAVRIGPPACPRGCLAISGTEPLPPSEVEAAEMLARNVALAWEMATLRADQRRHQAVLEAANAISLAVASSTDLKPTLEAVIEQTMSILQADAGSLLLADGRGRLEFVVTRGPVSTKLIGVRLERGQGIAGRVFSSGEAVRIDRAQARLEFDRTVDELTSYSTESILAAPLTLPDGIIGVIELLNRREARAFTDADLALLQSIANQTALLIRHARLVDQEMRTKREWEITLDAIGESIVVHESNGIISKLNRPAARLFGGEPEALLGARVQQLMEPHGNACVFCAAAADGDVNTSIADLTIGGRTFLASTAHVPSGQKSAIVHVLRDVTDRRRLERELGEKEKEKLAAIGMLIAGVAHELNNPLTSIMGYAQLAEMKAEGSQLERDVQIIRKEAGRACGIVRHLLDFAREEKIESKPLDLRQLLRDVIEAERMAMELAGIELKFDCPAYGLWATGDRPKLQQVFVNLVQNGRQELASLEGRPRLLNIRLWEQEGQAHVHVADNGRGISEENQARIFQPFFTTKAPGTGTGLGLAVSHGIVRKHCGSIWVDRAHTKGAAFEVALPSCQPGEEKSVSSEMPAAPVGLSRRLKILVVDDEEPIRTFLTRVLEGAGASVDSAPDADTALPWLRPNAYDLILCDWRMPGLPASEFYRRGMECSAARQWVFVSGDSANEELRKFAQTENVCLLFKPCGAAEVLRLLHDWVPDEKGSRATGR